MTTKQYPQLREAPKKTVKPGTVGVISGELSRYSIFSMALLGLLSYSGELVSHFDWLIGSNITGNCNDLAKRMQGDWLWLLADDHVFKHDLLERLVLHDVELRVSAGLSANPGRGTPERASIGAISCSRSRRPMASRC